MESVHSHHGECADVWKVHDALAMNEGTVAISEQRIQTWQAQRYLMHVELTRARRHMLCSTGPCGHGRPTGPSTLLLGLFDIYLSEPLFCSLGWYSSMGWYSLPWKSHLHALNATWRDFVSRKPMGWYSSLATRREDALYTEAHCFEQMAKAKHTVPAPLFRQSPQCPTPMRTPQRSSGPKCKPE